MQIALLILVLTCTVQAQEICKSCSPKDMVLQFGPEASEPRQPIFTPMFIFTESLHALAITTDAFITLKRENPHTCLEGQNGFPEFVHRKELVAEGAAEWGFGFGLGVLVHRVKLPKAFVWLPYMTPAWGTAIHIDGATRWYRNCH